MIKRCILSVFAGICLIANNLYAQQIENLQVKVLEDNVNILYDLTHEKTGQLFELNILCSNDGGKTYQVPIKTLSGDIGKNIEGGTSKIIIWDVLKDVKSLSGEQYVFKITATPQEIQKPTDFVEGFYFELMECYKKNGNIVCVVQITNQGKKRDIKIANRVARIYNQNGKRYEAQRSKIGNIQGNDLYSAPQATFTPGQKQMAFYSFKAENFPSRIKLFELGVDVMEITYGLDLKTGIIQFKDISLENPEILAKAEINSKPLKLSIGEETRTIKDTKPPRFAFSEPLLQKDKPAVVNSEEVTLKGNVKDENGIFEITINGMYASLADNGDFTADVYLVEGNNTVFVRAVDKFNNSIEDNYQIVYKPLEKKDQRQTNQKNNDPSLLNKEESSKGKYYALIIGVSEYPDPEIMDLNEPVNDAEKLYNTLTTYYTFEKENVKLLKNPTRETIIDELDRLNRTIKEHDNLLIFYAGHGYWDKQDEIGYWLPSDAKQANTANWMRNSTIRDYLRTVKTKHTLLIADACFSGGIFKTRKAFTDAPQSIQKLYDYPSRKAMTSGTLTEVPDKSVFLLYLNKRLTENSQPYISAEELFGSFKVAVMNNSPNVPQYGEIKDTGDEGGDFIFRKR